MSEWVYRTHAEARLLAAPDPESEQLGTIPAGTLLEGSDRDRFWIKVNYEGREGWATTALMDRLMAEPAPELSFYYNGYKIIGGVYRYFFGVANYGLQDYSGELSARLFSGDQQVFSETYTFADNPIVARGGRAFHLDTAVPADRFEMESEAGSFSDSTGRLIEEIP